MRHLGYWDETDYYHKEGPQKLSLWQKFTAYVLPFIVLAVICFLLYLFMGYVLQFMIEVSKPLCEEVVCKI